MSARRLVAVVRSHAGELILFICIPEREAAAWVNEASGKCRIRAAAGLEKRIFSLRSSWIAEAVATRPMHFRGRWIVGVTDRYAAGFGARLNGSSWPARFVRVGHLTPVSHDR